MSAAQHVQAAQHIGLPTLIGEALQHRQMLQRRSVEDDLGTVGQENLLQRSTIPDVAQDDVVGVEQAAAVDRQLHPVQRRLVAVEQHQLRRPEIVQLAGQLGADGTPSTGDQHHLAGNVVGDLAQVSVNGAASEQVGHVELTQRPQRDPAVDHLTHRRNHRQLKPSPLALLTDPMQQFGRSSRDGNDHLLGTPTERHLNQVVAGAEDPVAADPVEPFARIVVQIADDAVRRLKRAIDQLGHLVTRNTGPVDHHGGGARADLPRTELQHRARNAAARGHQRQRGRGDHHHHSSWQVRLKSADHQPNGHAEQQDERTEPGRLVEAADAVTSHVGVGQQADHRLQEDHSQRKRRSPLPLRPRQRELPAHLNQQEEREHPSQRIPGHQHAPANHHRHAHHDAGELAAAPAENTTAGR